jgi:hypothetical protein
MALSPTSKTSVRRRRLSRSTHGNDHSINPNNDPASSIKALNVENSSSSDPQLSTSISLPSPGGSCAIRQLRDASETDTSGTYPTDAVGDRGLFRLIVADYLQFLYPLVPIVHRPTFQQDIRHNRDCNDDVFLGLLYALCAATVAVLPSRFDIYQRHSCKTTYVDRKAMIYACYDEVVRLRKHDYFDNVNYLKWATHYLMYLAFFHIADYNCSRIWEVEANQLARLLNLHRISEYDGLNYIEIQLRKKAFWLTFYGFV